MKIQFFNKDNGVAIPDEQAINCDLFVLGNLVFQNNFRSCESQCDMVDFYSFIKERPELDWRVTF